jgi:hypothetical protein
MISRLVVQSASLSSFYIAKFGSRRCCGGTCDRDWETAEYATGDGVRLGCFQRSPGMGRARRGSRERQSLPRPLAPSIGDIFFP